MATPILRWAGSKRALLPTLLDQVPLSCGRYIEPFAGSACVFFALAPPRAVVSDLNSDLISFYRRLRRHPLALAGALHNMPRDVDSYYAIRAEDPSTLNRDRRAARFLYLNRMAFNGVYRTNRRGQFNVPLGRRVGAFPTAERIAESAQVLRRARLLAGDFEDALEDVGPGDFVYLDPPYSRSSVGNYGVYGYGSFDGRDLKRLVAAVEEIDRSGAHFLLSYTDTPELIALVARYHIRTVAVSAQVGGLSTRRSTRDELLVSNLP